MAAHAAQKSLQALRGSRALHRVKRQRAIIAAEAYRSVLHRKQDIAPTLKLKAE